MERKSKKLLFIILAMAIVVCAIELFSFVFFNVFKKSFTFFDFNQYVATDTIIKYAHQKYHPQRGWDNLYNTQFGERPRKNIYNRPFIATFGNSYTHCDDVKNKETWQEHLSLMVGRDVYNFGTGGYGTDQAYLKFLDTYQDVKAPVIILALVLENINRTVSVYRPFYEQDTGLRITKPRFVVRNDRLVLLENPIKDKSEIEYLSDPGFVSELGRNDYWYNQDNYPIYQSPYSKILLNKRLWLDLLFKIKGHKINDLNPRPWEDLWKNPEISDVMFRLFKSFADQSASENVIPIIMVIPEEIDLTYRLRTGSDKAGAKKIEEFCKKNNIPYFNPIEGFVDHVKAGKEISDLYEDHITSYGNQLIAIQLSDYLKDIRALK